MPQSAQAPLGAVFRSVVTTVVPESSALDGEAWSELEALAESTLRDRPADLQRQLRLFLSLIEWWPVPRYGRRFSSLDAARRFRVLSYLENHPLRRVRVGFWGLRTLALLGYYGRPEAARAIGYTPDFRGWEALE